MKIEYVKVKRALSKSSLPDLNYAFNPYIGCMHGCVYCYGRCFTKDKEASDNWGEVIKIKENILQLLKREVKRKKIGVVGISTITDPYQPIEEKEMITRRALEILSSAKFYISIQTKSDLVLRDLDLIKGDRFDVGVTITTLNDKTARLIEPRASPPSKRAEIIEELSEKGVKRWIFYGPIIPTINDDEETINEIAGLAKETNTEVIIDMLRLRPKIILSIKRSLGKRAEEILELSKNELYMERILRTVKSELNKRKVRTSFAFPQLSLKAFL